ncbi:MAG TPA: serine protease [Chthoniobacteraceae bacterium]|nr:serine protease [Chthoniobacteraceae bacterium]
MFYIRHLPVAFVAGLLCSAAAYAQEPAQSGTQPAQVATPPPSPPPRKEWRPGPPVTEGGLPVTDDLAIFFHIRDEGMALMAAQKFTPHDELLRQLNAAPDHAGLNITAAPLSTTPCAGLYEACKPGVLVVAGIDRKGRISPAGGIVLTADGVAVTNYHVAEGENATLVAMTSDRRVVGVKSILAASKLYDVAIIQLDGKGFTPLPLTSGAPVGTDIFALSHPGEHFYYLSRGIIARRAMSIHTPSEQGVPMLEITADYGRGSSGCPILDAAGQVVGMVKETMSLYYTEEHGNQQNLQMVFKDCVTAEEILKVATTGDEPAEKK